MPGTSAGSRRMVMRNRTISMRNPCLLFDERFELWRTTEALTVRALEQAGWTFWNRRNMAPYNKGPLAATGNIYLSYHIHFKAKWCQVHHLTSRMFPYCRDCWSRKNIKIQGEPDIYRSKLAGLRQSGEVHAQQSDETFHQHLGASQNDLAGKTRCLRKGLKWGWAREFLCPLRWFFCSGRRQGNNIGVFQGFCLEVDNWQCVD